MPNTLLLRLEGPLQAWGERARWSVRDTSPEPTKSGIVGLLACALGQNSDDDLRQLSRQVRIGVRCDRPGTTMTDYHTIVGGVMSAEGKIKINANTHEPETVVSRRSYLCDAAFLVAIQADDAALIARLAEAVQNPRWPIYLGRKSCPPSRPPFAGTGEYKSLKQALETLPLSSAQPAIGDKQASTMQVRAVVECSPAKGTRRRDEIDSRSRRTFLPRYTREALITAPLRQED